MKFMANFLENLASDYLFRKNAEATLCLKFYSNLRYHYYYSYYFLLDWRNQLLFLKAFHEIGHVSKYILPDNRQDLRTVCRIFELVSLVL